MHETLRLRGPTVEDSTCSVEEMQDICILLANSAYPANKASIKVQILEAYVFLYTNRNAVKWANGLAMCLTKLVEEFCSGKRSFWK